MDVYVAIMFASAILQVASSVDRPSRLSCGETNSSAISWVLLFLSIGIFVMVAQQQAVDFQKNRELLALKDQIERIKLATVH